MLLLAFTLAHADSPIQRERFFDGIRREGVGGLVAAPGGIVSVAGLATAVADQALIDDLCTVSYGASPGNSYGCSNDLLFIGPAVEEVLGAGLLTGGGVLARAAVKKYAEGLGESDSQRPSLAGDILMGAGVGVTVVGGIAEAADPGVSGIAIMSVGCGAIAGGGVIHELHAAKLRSRLWDVRHGQTAEAAPAHAPVHLEVAPVAWTVRGGGMAGLSGTF